MTSSSPAHPARRRVSRAAFWIGGTVLVTLAALIAVLSLRDWSFARGTLSSILSSKLDRPVAIDGPLTAWLLSTKPRVQLEGLKIGQPEWVTKEWLDKNDQRSFANVERIVVAINLGELFTGDLVLETLEIDNPHVAIIQTADRRRNFTFGAQTQTEQEQEDEQDENDRPPELPAIRNFSVRGGEVFVDDAIHKLIFKGQVEADEKITDAREQPFKLRGDGTLNGEPFKLMFEGGPLANVDMEKPYAFDVNITAGKTQGKASGEFAKPFDVATVTTRLNVKGENLAHLYYLTGLALPFTPPYTFTGDLASGARQVKVTGMRGTVGKSDIGGDITVDLRKSRPKLIAKLKSHSLNLVDLSPAFGKGVPVDSKGDTLDSVAPKALPPDRLLPQYEFQFDRLRTMDADVSLRADSVQTQKAPFTGINLNLKLNDGVLDLKPIEFTLPQGTIAGNINIDAREKIAKSSLDLRVTNVKLDQFKGKDATNAALDGTLQARAQLVGTGNSVHAFATSADGKVNAVIPRGEIREAFAELTGINVARGLGLILSKDQDRMDVRCGVAAMNVHDGKADLEQFVFDTKTVLIKGDGDINLASEKLDLEIEGHPKKIRLLRLRAPVKINGSLRDPDVGIDVAETAKQAGIAGALGALIAPITAALAFIDPGLAKDADCAALLAEAEKEVPNAKVSAVAPAAQNPAPR
ncbi:MAG TPA: AsmA family protein [Steroidobacteraceae bacterium]|nr:AsmA family protein [Steroidobacteraceae bacterium]